MISTNIFVIHRTCTDFSTSATGVGCNLGEIADWCAGVTKGKTVENEDNETVGESKGCNEVLRDRVGVLGADSSVLGDGDGEERGEGVGVDSGDTEGEERGEGGELDRRLLFGVDNRLGEDVEVELAKVAEGDMEVILRARYGLEDGEGGIRRVATVRCREGFESDPVFSSSSLLLSLSNALVSPVFADFTGLCLQLILSHWKNSYVLKKIQVKVPLESSKALVSSRILGNCKYK